MTDGIVRIGEVNMIKLSEARPCRKLLDVRVDAETGRLHFDYEPGDLTEAAQLFISEVRSQQRLADVHSIAGHGADGCRLTNGH